jgi:hypothetical protein
MCKGILAETASAAALASNLLDPEQPRQAGILGILTSHGLKNSLALTSVFSPPLTVEGTWEALRNWLG